LATEEGVVEQRRPSFLCIIADQMRGDHLGCDGNPVIETPHLDRLAASGVRFRRAYVNNPLCMPCRATLFTGLTPRGHGVRTNGIPLDRRLPTLPAALAEAGYRTHAVGKMHLLPFGTPRSSDPAALDPREWPESAHFWRAGLLAAVPTPYFGLQTVEISIGHGPGTTGDYQRWLEERDPQAEQRWRPEAGQPTPHGAEQAWHCALPQELHYNHWVADRTIAFLEQQQPEQPFFLWCSFPDPHHPYCPPEPWASKYDPAAVPPPTRREGELADLPPHYRMIYERAFLLSGRRQPARMDDAQLREIIALTYGMISHVDQGVGRILDALEQRGLRESTVVCFLSDHGDMMGDHWMMNKGPFHLEGLLRVPCLWSCPGLIPQGVVADSLVSYLDVAPTILELAGVPIPEGPVPAVPEAERQLAPWPGVSFASRLRGGRGPEQESLVVENDEDYLGLRLRTLVTGRYLITAYPGQGYGELFDLQEDGGQLYNLWADPARQGRKRELLVRLMERLVETDQRLPRRLCHA